MRQARKVDLSVLSINYTASLHSRIVYVMVNNIFV